MQMIYAFVTYNLFTSIMFTIVGIARSSLLALMTQDMKERGSMAAFGMFFGLGSTILGMSLTFPLIFRFGGNVTAWRIVFCIYGAVTMLGLLYGFFFSKEYVTSVAEATQTKEKLSFGEEVKLFFTNRYLIIALVMTVLVNFVTQIGQASQTYFYTYSMGDPMLTTSLNLVSIGTIDVTADKHIVTEPYYGDSGENVNRFIQDSHKRLLGVLKSDPSAAPAALPGMADIRMARRIDGSYELADKDANTHFEDNIACTGDWRRPGPVYEIPYRTLFNNDLRNVLSAGRCISTSGEAWEIIRCIPQASATGQAAGTALAMALDCGVDVQDLDVMRLRETLKADGMILDANKG